LDLQKARERGIAQRAIVFPLGGSYHEFYAVPIDLITRGANGEVVMSLSAMEKFVAGLGPFFGEYRDGVYVSNMERYAPVRRASKPNVKRRMERVLALLGDEESREDFAVVFTSDPLKVWKHWARDLYNGLQYTDYVRISPEDVVLNCGVHGGQELLHYLAHLGPDGMCVNIDPLGHAYLTNEVRTAISQSPSKIIEIAAALHDEPALLELPVEPGGMAVGNSVGLQIQGAPSQCFRAVTLENLVAEAGLEKIDHIKMDIEGSEERALAGGIEVIKRFRPGLAISIYHTPDQFLDIPLFLAEHLRNYHFFVRNYHFISNETILYAIPNERPYTRRSRSIQVSLLP
jgi:FkbM family methyltransferase